MIEGATGKFLLQQTAAVSELEAGMISACAKAALAAARCRGVKLGGDRGARLTAQAQAAGRAAAVQERSRKRAIDLAPSLRSYERPAVSHYVPLQQAWRSGVLTARGGKWSAVQVARLLEAASIPFADANVAGA